MKSARIAVRLPDALVRRARSAVRRGRASSLSSYVATALEEKAKLDDLEDLLSQMLTSDALDLRRLDPSIHVVVV
jgi:Arc/MetJ-type ribon-helix-helix transcriptional regulator